VEHNLDALDVGVDGKQSRQMLWLCQLLVDVVDNADALALAGVDIATERSESALRTKLL